ncbi:unnamed protein product [Urochloa humidicola]
MNRSMELDAPGEPDAPGEVLELKEPIILPGHNDKVWSVSWNPNPCNQAEHMLASAGDDKVIIWHCFDSNWSIFKLLENEEGKSLRSCAWHPQGTIIAAGGVSSSIKLWRYDEGINAFPLLGKYHNHDNEIVHSLEWSLDGLLLCCSNESVSIIRDCTEGEYTIVSHIYLGENAPLSCAKWYPNGSSFAVAGEKKITICEVVEENENVQTQVTEVTTSFHGTGHNGAIFSISFLSDEKMVSAGEDNRLKFWQLDSTSKRGSGTQLTSMKRSVWRLVMTSEKHERDISCIDWSRCSGMNLIANACENRTITFYMPQDKKRVFSSQQYVLAGRQNLAHLGSIKDLKWHCQDPYKFASVGSDCMVKIWEVIMKKKKMMAP